jgi:hypothetical protein
MKINFQKGGEEMSANHSSHWLIRFFFYSSALSLALTACAKVISAFGKAPILDSPDVLFPIRTRLLLCVVGITEIIIVALLLSQMQTRIKIFVLLWLAFSFFLYKTALFALHAPLPCPCLGTVTASLGIAPKTATIVTDVFLMYYLTGSLIYLGLSDKRIVNKM